MATGRDAAAFSETRRTRHGDPMSLDTNHIKLLLFCLDGLSRGSCREKSSTTEKYKHLPIQQVLDTVYSVNHFSVSSKPPKYSREALGNQCPSFSTHTRLGLELDG